MHAVRWDPRGCMQRLQSITAEPGFSPGAPGRRRRQRFLAALGVWPRSHSGHGGHG